MNPVGAQHSRGEAQQFFQRFFKKAKLALVFADESLS